MTVAHYFNVNRRNNRRVINNTRVIMYVRCKYRFVQFRNCVVCVWIFIIPEGGNIKWQKHNFG